MRGFRGGAVVKLGACLRGMARGISAVKLDG